MADRLIEWGAAMWDLFGPLITTCALIGVGIYVLMTLIGGDD